MFFNRVVKYKEQPLEVFCKNSVIKNFANFTGKHRRWSLFVIKLQSVRSILKKPYFEEHLRMTAFKVPRVWECLCILDNSWWMLILSEQIFKYMLLVLQFCMAIFSLSWLTNNNNKNKPETLLVVKIAMICSTLVSLWKCQYFPRPI